ncbi:MAG: hypothetical protein M2R45_00225 [Verrucomicrobia subdivision 3 bacterium]|nr:hypothetical protein [Limisphaerales bacterium]MCS1412317.1 hypothetical protein [Limisphaerales bacterium]
MGIRNRVQLYRWYFHHFALNSRLGVNFDDAFNVGTYTLADQALVETLIVTAIPEPWE